MIWILLAWLVVAVLFMWSFSKPGFENSTQILKKYQVGRRSKSEPPQDL